MRDICVVDTSICTNNIGDEIILDSINKIIDENFSDSYIHRVPSHSVIDEQNARLIRNSDLCFIAGTNILSSHMHIRGTWKIDLAISNIYKETDVAALGVGWNDYMGVPDEQSKQILRNVLSPHLKHSVRDIYTGLKLETVGRNSLHTSCPTVWELTKEHCRDIPVNPSDSVIFTLTCWRADEKADRLLIQMLKKLYRRVYFFAQMREDLDYFYSFNETGIFIITPSLKGYDTVLDNEDVDFVGTRLHGGIRALQKKKRTLIIAVDNRAIELGAGIGLPSVLRKDMKNGILQWFDRDFLLDITLPEAGIKEFMGQFPLCRNSHKYFAPQF